MVEASRARSNVAQALFELRSECGLPLTANIKQCLRVLLQRLANCPDVVNCQLSSENVVSNINFFANYVSYYITIHRYLYTCASLVAFELRAKKKYSVS